MSFLSKAVTALHAAKEATDLSDLTRKFTSLEKDPQQLEKERLRAEEIGDPRKGAAAATRKRKGLGGAKPGDASIKPPDASDNLTSTTSPADVQRSEGDNETGAGATATSDVPATVVHVTEPVIAPESPAAEVEAEAEAVAPPTAAADGWDTTLEELGSPLDGSSTPASLTFPDAPIATHPPEVPQAPAQHDAANPWQDALLAVGSTLGLAAQDPAPLATAICTAVQELREDSTAAALRASGFEDQSRHLRETLAASETRSASLFEQLTEKGTEHERLGALLAEARAAAQSQERLLAANAELTARSAALEAQLRDTPAIQTNDDERERLAEAERAAATLKGLLGERTDQLERLSQQLSEMFLAQARAEEWASAARVAAAQHRSAVEGRGAAVAERRRGLLEAEAALLHQLQDHEAQRARRQITLKGEGGREARSLPRADVIAVLQRRIAALKADLTAATATNEALTKQLEASPRPSPRPEAEAPTPPVPEGDRPGVLATHLETLGRHVATAASALSERAAGLKAECARLEAQEKDAAQALADTKVSLVATAGAGQRSAPKSDILKLLKQRLGDLRAENARGAERLLASERRLADTQEALRKAEQEREDLLQQKTELQQAAADHAARAADAAAAHLQEQLQESTDRAEDLACRLQAREAELLEARSAQATATAATEAAQEQQRYITAELRAHTLGLEAQLQELQVEVANLREQAAVAQSELRSKCDQVEELQDAHRRLLTDHAHHQEEEERRAAEGARAAQQERGLREAAHRAELAALRESLERQVAQAQAELRAVQQEEDDRRTSRLRTLEREAADKDAVVKDLQDRLAQLKQERARPSSISGPGAEDDVGRQQQQAARERERERELIGLARRESTRSYERMGLAEDKKADPGQEYLKNVVLQYLCAKDQDLRAGLVPVLSTVLQFSPEEMQAVWRAHRTWRW